MYKLSKLAAEDFAAIFEYTLLNFGLRQAESYTEKLENSFLLLSSNPMMGQLCTEIATEVRRHDQQRHSIFYRHRAHDILVIRILHQHMDPIIHVGQAPPDAQR